MKALSIDIRGDTRTRVRPLPRFYKRMFRKHVEDKYQYVVILLVCLFVVFPTAMVFIFTADFSATPDNRTPSLRVSEVRRADETSLSGGDHRKDRTIRVRCQTTVSDQNGGIINFDLYESWAPIGVAHAVDLIENNFFSHVPFFRAVDNFLVQFGIAVENEAKKYEGTRNEILDDPHNGIHFTDGIVSFAGHTDNSRSTHLFFTRGTQPHLGKAPWEVPIGRVCDDSMKTMHAIYSGYKEALDQQRLHGNREDVMRYLEDYPRLDWIDSCSIIPG